MNGHTQEFLSRATLDLQCAQVNDYSDLTAWESQKVDELIGEILALMEPPTFSVELEGWWWNDDERKFRTIAPLNEFGNEREATEHARHLVSEHKALCLAPLNALCLAPLNEFFDGTAVVVYESRGVSKRCIEMWLLEQFRPDDFYYGDDAEHEVI